MRRRRLLGGIPLTAAGLTAANFRLAGIARAQSALGDVGTANPAAPVNAAPAYAVQAPKLDDQVGAGLQRSVIVRWGDGVVPNAPPFTPEQLTEDEAASQFAYDGVIAGVLQPPASDDGVARLVVVLANPAAPARMVFPGRIDHPAIAGKLQGATILNLQAQGGRWLLVAGGYQSRRLTDGTLCQLSGPAAGSIGATVQGVLAPPGGCVTPWATALLAEGDPAPWLTRLAGTGNGYADPAEAARFGWIVELAPLDPGSFPIKRTALGRFAKAGVAATTKADGTPVIFMTEDDKAGCLFRFIAAGNATDGTALDTGVLSVARIDDDQITWVDLGQDIASLVGAAGAARSAGGSAFDAPGGLAVGPGGTLYLACGGNPDRAPEDANALNPRPGDDNGHVIAFIAAHGDLTSRTFTGEIAIAGGDPGSVQGTQYTAGSDSWLRKPRTLNLDADGGLWIGTDQQGATTATADGLFVMQTGGPARYQLRTAYLAPVGAAIGGAAFSPSGKTAFAMVRHPGATPAASFDQPATRWPLLRPDMPPQSTMIGLDGI